MAILTIQPLAVDSTNNFTFNNVTATANLLSTGGRVYLTGFTGLTVGRWYGSSGNPGTIGSGSIIYSAEL